VARQELEQVRDRGRGGGAPRSDQPDQGRGGLFAEKLLAQADADLVQQGGGERRPRAGLADAVQRLEGERAVPAITGEQRDESRVTELYQAGQGPVGAAAGTLGVRDEGEFVGRLGQRAQLPELEDRGLARFGVIAGDHRGQWRDQPGRRVARDVREVAGRQQGLLPDSGCDGPGQGGGYQLGSSGRIPMRGQCVGQVAERVAGLETPAEMFHERAIRRPGQRCLAQLS
jgi:hypothetical protein